MEECGLHPYDIRQGLEAASCERGNEASGFIGGAQS
jgi:hypothetical protein